MNIVAHAPTLYELGQRDAEAGLDCVPEMYVTAKAKIISYCQGYLSVVNSTTAEWFVSKQVTI